jgi:hypothetical protein
MNLIIKMSNENTLRIKPLTDYLQDIKSRNFKFNNVIPGLDKQFENISNYDELYKKLIEESYFLCNELITKKNNSRNINNNERDLTSGVERHLIFNSSDNLKPKPKYEQENNKNISPIGPYENKSIFFSGAKGGNGPQVNSEDILYLINNCKEIENLLEEQNGKIRENYDTKLQDNLKQLERFKTYAELEYVENKHELEGKLNEIKALSRQFDERVDRFNEYIETCKNTIPSMTTGGTYDNRRTAYGSDYRGEDGINNPFQERSKLADINNYLNTIKSSGNVVNQPTNTTKKGVFDYIYTDSPRDSNVMQQKKKELSGLINNLFIDERVPEALELWKQLGYEALDGISPEKCCDLLSYIVRHKDKEIDACYKKIDKLEKTLNDHSQKNADIIRLMAEVESYKLKVNDIEHFLYQLSVAESKMEKLINENSLLYKENKRLKLLVEEYEYKSKRKLNFI